MLSPLVHDDPQALGRYRLIARLGSGGMGTVYLGRSPRGRTVALKTMHREFAAQREFRARFQLEVDAARVIGGHHGAEVVDADALAETPWMATEYVLGLPLDDLVTVCGPLPEAATRAIGARLCGALAQLHGSHVVHRDLKPSNILITAQGPKVIDFGIARAAGDDRLTRTGAAAGTPAFMSPEQATGQEHTPAGDVFALAGVLVFASSGHGPFGTGQTADLLYRVRYSQPDLSQVPDELVGVLERCLAKDPLERPTVQEFGRQLGGGAGKFEDSLPDPVLAEILRRCGVAWEVPPPRLPAPSFGDAAPARPEAVRSAGRLHLTRRRALILGGGATLAAAAATGGAWALFRPDDAPAAKKAPSPPSGKGPATAPKPNWQRRFDGESPSLQSVLTGNYVAVVMDGRLTTVDMEGEDAGTNRNVQDEPLVTDRGRFYGVSNKLILHRVDAKTAAFGERVADLNDLELRDLNVHGPILIGAYKGTVVVQGKPKHGPDDTLKRHLVALDAETGKVRWRDKTEMGAKVAAAVRDTLILVDDIGRIWAIDMGKGKVTWSRKFDSLMDAGSSVGVDPEGHIYLGLDEIFALRVSDGKTLWRFGEGRSLQAPPGQKSKPYYGTPLYKKGIVYTLEPGTGVVALDARTGKLRWEAEAGWAVEVPPDAVPVSGDQYLYFPSRGSRLVTAFDLKTRAVKWVYIDPDKALDPPNLLTHPDSHQLVVATDKRVFALPLK
ncbi:serine/threonine-protein kinase [Streptomyces sp. 891-h]|uniref:serine/threonine-protein kinase n=1 Tax=Streptomyces sp. 891-h TaxID=2720714 RepID=UPI001FAAB6E4|nr:serine/threonine-protein kinase [Streptomyces sp. 891-h]UNZ16616.1 PQQ-binding-like beta-propeller repeat protein [Streptomyces sp. 891-h]